MTQLSSHSDPDLSNNIKREKKKGSDSFLPSVQSLLRHRGSISRAVIGVRSRHQCKLTFAALQTCRFGIRCGGSRDLPRARQHRHLPGSRMVLTSRWSKIGSMGNQRRDSFHEIPSTHVDRKIQKSNQAWHLTRRCINFLCVRIRSIFFHRTTQKS